MSEVLTTTDVEMLTEVMLTLNKMAREVERAWMVLTAATMSVKQPETDYVRVPAAAFQRVGDTMTRYAEQAFAKLGVLLADWEATA